MIIFASDDVLKVLAKSKRWQSDGTLSCVPAGIKQLYLIHGYYEWQMIPCVFALLKAKTELLNKSLISSLKENALNLFLELKPEFVMTDFELAVMNSFKIIFQMLI